MIRSARASVVIAAAVLAVLAGCASDRPDPAPAPSTVVPVDPEAITAAWNARVADLDRLWARVTLVVNTVDAEGEPVREQAEGHLQIERPRRVALSLGKLGETYLYLGSNDERYWWIDAIDRDNRVGVLGRHELVTPRKAAALGVPVHPLDLVELIGILPLPDNTTFTNGDEPGTIDATRPVGAAELTWVLDAESYTPRRAVLTGPEGEVLLEAEHEAYQFARVRDDLAARPRVPGRVVVNVPSIPARVRLALYEPENKPIKPVAFDQERLFRAFRVDTVHDLDETAESAGVQP